MIRDISAAEPQVRTGPLRFGDDWPGIFIRGDEALGMADRLNLGIELGNWKEVERVIDLLRSCRVNGSGTPRAGRANVT